MPALLPEFSALKRLLFILVFPSQSMEKTILLFALLAAVALIVLSSGCVAPSQPVCGNGICETPQENEENCPISNGGDCPPPSALQTCSQQGGIVCEDYELCNANILESSDSDKCCSGDCLANGLLSYPVVREKMVWNIPELSNFAFGGRVSDTSQSPYELDLRYKPSENQDQNSEYLLVVYSAALTDSFLEEQAENQRTIWDSVSLIEIEGNKVFEASSELPAGVQRSVFWVSGNNFINGWNGNDLGTIIDDKLFNVLTAEYLMKYPSTYQGQ